MDAAITNSAPPKFNGIAEITVDDARSAKTDKVHAVCIDEPLADFDEHALIALVTDEPPGHLSEEERNAVRALLAEKMRVVRKPE